MYGLMYKDLAVNKKNLLILFGGFLLMHILQFLGGGELEDENAAFLITAMSVAMAFMISGAAESYLFAADERKKFAFWVISSQTGVKALVGAKYLFVFVLAVLSVVLSISINALSIDLAGNAANSSALCIMLFYVQLFLRGVEIPFLYAFGTKSGNNVRAVIMMTVALAVSVYLLFGDISSFGSLEDMWKRIFDFLDTEQSPAVIITISVMGLSVFPLYYLSYVISCRVYKRGVTSYDK
ncbi:MAG: ABC-2 transporter permease [Oribacterium sp.]|nr:ABC-2 transporter permease [Oribacterium sp.]